MCLRQPLLSDDLSLLTAFVVEIDLLVRVTPCEWPGLRSGAEQVCACWGDTEQAFLTQGRVARQQRPDSKAVQQAMGLNCTAIDSRDDVLEKVQQRFNKLQ